MPDPKAQIPTPDELIGPGIDAFVALRPGALRHIDSPTGVYSRVFAGWRAQAVVMVQRLADYAKQGRIKFAEGEPLNFLAGSEFDTLNDLGATKAMGSITLQRSTGTYPGGPIPKGTRFQRISDPSAARLFKAAQVEAAEAVYVPQGATSVTVPIIASREGTYAGRPITGSTVDEVTIADEIVDKGSWVVVSYELGGGSDAASDDDKRRYARAFARGKYGPTANGAVAGALKLGARHVAAVDDPDTGSLVLHVADGGWAASTRWAGVIRQRIYDPQDDTPPIVGYGCRVTCAPLANEVVGVECTVRLRSSDALAETSELDAVIQATIRAYFDDRDDFYAWRSASLRGVIARADRRILSCSVATVRRFDGTVVTEPVSGSTPLHYMLAQNSVRVTYQSPI
jgi:hypothetical protein